MDIDKSVSDAFRKDLFFVGVSLLLVVAAAGTHNVLTPDRDMEVGMVELHTYCSGIEAGVCIGIQKREHTTYNYDKYEEVRPGTKNFYRRVESELMARAYNVCSQKVTGWEWTSKVEYRNRTAAEWRQMDQVELLPCGMTFWRDMKGNP